MARLNAIFDTVPYRSPKVSTFSANHDIKTTTKIGEVSPLDVIPVYPKDDFNIRYRTQAKFSPLVAPAFQRMSVKQWSFYVRNSDLWSDFDEFFTGNNPRKGKTAYLPDTTPPAHPHFQLNSSTQMGTSYLGVKPIFTDIDLTGIGTNDDGHSYYIPESVIIQMFDQLIARKNTGENPFRITYEDGSKIKRCYSPLLGGAGDINFQYNNSVLDTENYSGPTIVTTFKNLGRNSISDSFFPMQCQTFRGFKPLFSPGSLCDYLGYPTFDFKHYFDTKFKDDYLQNRDKFKRNDGIVSSLQRFLERYLAMDENSIFAQLNKFPNGTYELLGLFGGNDTSRAGYFLSTATKSYSGSDTFSYLPFMSPTYNGSFSVPTWGNSTAGNIDISLGDLLAYYAVWMFENNVNTTDVSFCPYADFVYLCHPNDLEFSKLKVDSLRIRAYHKIWNDYYRRPDLTSEIPIPYDDGGNDFVNYLVAVQTFLSTTYDGKHLLDWTRNDLFKDKKFTPYIGKNQEYLNNQFVSNYASHDTIKRYVDSLVCWDLLTNCFNHLRQRDYLTSALPDTSVVDVITPIGSPESLSNYNNPYTNNQTLENGEFEKTNIDPSPASEINTAVGWLDLENLRITQVLKRYFTTLRHTLQGVKDYIKVYFDVDIDDLSVHRALWLGGNEQMVRVSELTGSAETEKAPLGSLGGKADLYSESGTINHFVKECGFIVTLHCLSPIESNIGGVHRELIRDDKFDYFLPDFAELGDQRIDKYEICCAPIVPKLDPHFNSLFGYVQRYLHLKYIPSSVHGDFLGSKSDWHLDLLQPAIQVKDDIQLTQQWLEERDDDRIFTDIYDDESNCVIWCECDGTFRRALPVAQYEVLA